MVLYSQAYAAKTHFVYQICADRNYVQILDKKYIIGALILSQKEKIEPDSGLIHFEAGIDAWISKAVRNDEYENDEERSNFLNISMFRDYEIDMRDKYPI